VAPAVGSAFDGSLESGGRFYFGAFDTNLASVAVKMFSHSVQFIKKFYKCFTLNAICEDFALINCSLLFFDNKNVHFCQI
jgi:hypothetical protein